MNNVILIVDINVGVFEELFNINKLIMCIVNINVLST